jgi:hypothetical protein
MNAIEIWRDFQPGEARIRSMVFEDAWYPFGIKDERLVSAMLPGAKAAHRINIEETTSEEIFEIATDGERWIFLETIPTTIGDDQWETVVSAGEPPVLTIGDRDLINRLIVYHLTKLIQYHQEGLHKLAVPLELHMTRYDYAADAFYDCA